MPVRDLRSRPRHSSDPAQPARHRESAPPECANRASWPSTRSALSSSPTHRPSCETLRAALAAPDTPRISSSALRRTTNGRSRSGTSAMSSAFRWAATASSAAATARPRLAGDDCERSSLRCPTAPEIVPGEIPSSHPPIRSNWPFQPRFGFILGGKIAQNVQFVNCARRPCSPSGARGLAPSGALRASS